jgi:pre-mRNA-processing factor 40
LELFWDTVDTLDQKLDAKIAIAEECAKRGDDPNAMDVVKGDKEKEHSSVVSVQMTFEEFKARVRRDPDSVSKLGEDDLREVYDTVCYFFA